ncbi:MAG: hypothetical protein AAF708_00505 [Deinococcota bacterium]
MINATLRRQLQPRLKEPQPQDEPAQATPNNWSEDTLHPTHPLLDKPSFVPLICLLVICVFGVALESWVVGGTALFLFFVSLDYEPFERKLRYLALAASITLLSVAPINTNTADGHFYLLGTFFLAALVIPAYILRGRGVIIYRLFPKHIDRLELFYTAISIPIAYLAIQLYFRVLSPEVPYNWVLPTEPNNEELFRLFLGINGVGIWDELFFVNTSYAIIRSLFPYKWANPAQAVVYTSILWDMTFRGFGPLFVYTFAITQGAMYERSRVLLWVLIVHLIVDYFLFQQIVATYYPHLDVWWH